MPLKAWQYFAVMGASVVIPNLLAGIATFFYFIRVDNRKIWICTIMDTRGAIAGANNTLICYISYFELPIMKEIISSHSGSFSTVSTIDEILR